MKIIFVISVLVAIQAVAAVLNFREEWAAFKEKEGKSYNTETEEAHRFQVFVHNLQKIEKHNKKYHAGLVSYYLGVNKFSDLTHEEYRQRLGFKASKSAESTSFVRPAESAVPDSIDWRSKGAVTPVKDQGSCGSCWAFSTTGSLEGQFFMKHGKLVSLSEQNLVDCSTSNGACNGGEMKLAFDDIKKNGGIDTEESYPYEGQNGTCRYNPKNSAGQVSGYVAIKAGDEDDLKSTVATVGPVSVAIDASSDSFQQYRGGVYDEPNCKSEDDQLDHAVLVVGYGTTDDGKDYWLVKNSWSESWGKDGYIQMSRNKNNQCGIATDAVYPTVV